jgi:hypothetical protein
VFETNATPDLEGFFEPRLVDGLRMRLILQIGGIEYNEYKYSTRTFDADLDTPRP